MAQTFNYWCKNCLLDQVVLYTKLAVSISNFPSSYISPEVGDIVGFEARTSDTGYEEGTALIIRNRFVR